MPLPSLVSCKTGKDIVCPLRNKGICDERTGVNEPLVYRLFCQGHCRVAMFGRDKRWKHISAKPTSRLDFPIDPRKTIWLIGTRCTHSNVFSRGVLIGRLTFLHSNARCKRRTQEYVWLAVCGHWPTHSETVLTKSAEVVNLRYGAWLTAPVLLARGIHWFPSRTPKLRPAAAMILERGK